MKSLNPSMRLKVKRDTFFLPDPGRGVFFRNHSCSFQMEGNSIDQWVEKLIPMFNGKFTLENLTTGLPETYRKRVYEIAEILYRNGFVQDVSKDLPHQLSEKILEKYASQIEFLQNLADSGAYRFQTYRQQKVLAVGSGSIFVSLISSLLESGLPKFQLLITDSVATNRKRIEEIVQHAQKTDQEIEINEISLKYEGLNHWQNVLQRFDSILYVSQEDNVEELLRLDRICKEQEKLLLPAICMKNAGLAGPLVHPDSAGSFESLWRNLHPSVLSPYQDEQKYSGPAGAMLANVIVFELFKQITGAAGTERQNQFFLLNLVTLEGNWHLFKPHPILTGETKARWVEDMDLRLKQKENSKQQGDLIVYFSQLTSAQSGIFHVLDEEDLIQLPLAQCRVQVIDPLSEGPAELLPSIVCAEFTHYLARKEAGLMGIEAYVSRMKNLLMKTLPQRKETEEIMDGQESAAFGAGETFAEAVCRGLQRWLTEELNKNLFAENHTVAPVELSGIEDERCRYYLQVLTTMRGAPTIGIGKELFGFPVIWAGTEGRWFVSTGLNTTLALRSVLKKVLMSENSSESLFQQSLDDSSILLEDKVPPSLTILDCENTDTSSLLNSALQVMEENQKMLLTFEVQMESILKKELLSVYGVLLREVESL